MSWFNYIGLIIIAIIMIPNFFYFKSNINAKESWHNNLAEVFEGIGRYGCFILMIFNVPYTYCGFFFDKAIIFYISVNAVLVLAYCIIWIFTFKKNSLFKAIALSVLPSLTFIFSGIMILSIPLIICSLIFAPTHILISIKNNQSI